MIVYWSMVGWVFLIYFIYSITHKEKVDLRNASSEQIIQNRVSLMYAIITFGYLIFWCSVRGSIFDTVVYIDTYKNIPTDFNEAWNSIAWDSKGPFFYIYSIIFKCFISPNYTWWLTSIAVACGLCIMITLRKYSVNFFYSCILFMLLGTYTWLFNGMRQFIAVSILFLLVDWIKGGKFFRFLLLVVILSQFHITAWLMLPMFFIVRVKPWSARTCLLILATVLICIFSEPFFDGINDIMSGTAYEGEHLILDDDDGVNPLRVLLYLIPPTLAFLKRKDLEIYYDKFPIISISINMSLMAALLYFVGMFTSGILVGRLPIYFELYNLILIPFLLQVCFKENERKIIYPLLTLVLLVYFYLNSGTLPYNSELTGWIN